MNKHKSIPGLRSRRSGNNIHLEIAFDARPLDQNGAQWITIHVCSTTDSAALSEGDTLPREVTDGEQEMRVGRVRRTMSIKSDLSASGEWPRLLELAVGVNSPYTLLRHTRLPDGSIKDEKIYPWPSDEEQPGPTVPGDLWSC